MVRILVPFWDGPFSGVVLVSGGVSFRERNLTSTASQQVLNLLPKTRKGARYKRHQHLKEVISYCPRVVAPIAHMIHVWYIYLNLVDIYGKCRWIYHAGILWGCHSLMNITLSRMVEVVTFSCKGLGMKKRINKQKTVWLLVGNGLHPSSIGVLWCITVYCSFLLLLSTYFEWSSKLNMFLAGNLIHIWRWKQGWIHSWLLHPIIMLPPKARKRPFRRNL